MVSSLSRMAYLVVRNRYAMKLNIGIIIKKIGQDGRLINAPISTPPKTKNTGIASSRPIFDL